MLFSLNIHNYLNNTFHESKVLKKVMITAMFNVDFQNKFIKFLIILFFLLFFILLDLISLFTSIYIYIYIYIRCLFTYCYATMCPTGLQGAVHSRQVHQLTQGTDIGCGLPTLFNVTDITNSLAEPHFKGTR